MKTVGHEKYNNQLMSDTTIDCLMYTKRCIELHGFAPLYSEIAETLGMTKNQVVRCMTNLEALGFIRYTRERARGYVVTKAGQMFKPAGYTVNKKSMVWSHYELTDIELETMRSINALFVQYQFPPSLTEICERAGLSSTAHASYILKGLRDKGYIEENPIVVRSYGPNQFKKVITRTEKGVKVGTKWLTR